MDFLEKFKLLWFLSLFVLSEARYLYKREVDLLDETPRDLEALRTPQKYIIEPIQTLTKNSDNLVSPPYDAVDFGEDDKLNEIEAKNEDSNLDLVKVVDDLETKNKPTQTVDEFEIEVQPINPEVLNQKILISNEKVNIPTELPEEIVKNEEISDVINELNSKTDSSVNVKAQEDLIKVEITLDSENFENNIYNLRNLAEPEEQPINPIESSKFDETEAENNNNMTNLEELSKKEEKTPIEESQMKEKVTDIPNQNQINLSEQNLEDKESLNTENVIVESGNQSKDIEKENLNAENTIPIQNNQTIAEEKQSNFHHTIATTENNLKEKEIKNSEKLEQETDFKENVTPINEYNSENKEEETMSSQGSKEDGNMDSNVSKIPLENSQITPNFEENNNNLDEKSKPSDNLNVNFEIMGATPTTETMEIENSSTQTSTSSSEQTETSTYIPLTAENALKDKNQSQTANTSQTDVITQTISTNEKNQTIANLSTDSETSPQIVQKPTNTIQETEGQPISTTTTPQPTQNPQTISTEIPTSSTSTTTTSQSTQKPQTISTETSTSSTSTTTIPTTTITSKPTTPKPIVTTTKPNVSFTTSRPTRPTRPTTSRRPTSRPRPPVTQRPPGWFPNFPGLPPLPILPTLFINPFNTTTTTSTNNQTQSTFGFGIFAVPWSWRPNFSNFFAPNRIIETRPPSNDALLTAPESRDLAFWNAIFHRGKTQDGGADKQTNDKDKDKDKENGDKPDNTETTFWKPFSYLFPKFTTISNEPATIPANTQVLHLYFPLKYPFHGQIVQTATKTLKEDVVGVEDKIATVPKARKTIIKGKEPLKVMVEDNDKIVAVKETENDEVSSLVKIENEEISDSSKVKNDEKTSLRLEVELPRPMAKLVKGVMANFMSQQN